MKLFFKYYLLFLLLKLNFIHFDNFKEKIIDVGTGLIGKLPRK